MVKTNEDYIKLLESELRTKNFVPLNESEILAFIRMHQLDKYQGIVVKDVQSDIRTLINLHRQGKTAYSEAQSRTTSNAYSGITVPRSTYLRLAKNQVVGMSGKTYTLEEKPFSSGGEGDIFGIVGEKAKVVKIYHSDRINIELEEKLKTMVRRPPSSTVLSQVAWPLDTIYDSKGCFCGFVMPRLSITSELNEIYAYPPKTSITYQQKLILAQNICVVISEVHKAGYIFGDFNPRNIGINTNTGSVAFLDTDSYHIVDGNKTYRCKVCLDGYVAPELLKKCEAYKKDAYASAPLPTFTKETDNFALAIHIFKLLMNGFTPFNGIKETERASTASPGVGNQAIKRDQYCFKPGNKPMSPAVPPLDALPDTIADLFTRAFMYGRIDPKERPSALEWHKALSNYEASLVKCSLNGTHMYRRGLRTCPWCEADERYKTATAPTIIQKSFSSPVVPTTAPSSGYGYSASMSRPQQKVTSSVYGTPVTTPPPASYGAQVKASSNVSVSQNTDPHYPIRKTVFVVALVTIAVCTLWTLSYTSRMNYHGNFEDWLENAYIKLGISYLFAGIAYGINFDKGFKIDYNGYSFWMFVLPIIHAVVYTVFFVKYTSDFGAVIVMPLILLTFYFLSLLAGWIAKKIS